MSVEVRPAPIADTPATASWEPPVPRRGRAWATVLAGALAVGVWAAARPAVEMVEVLVVGSDGDTLALDAGDGTFIAAVAGGVPSPDGSVVVASEAAGERTVVTAIDTATGAEVWRRDAPPGQSPRLVSPDGGTVVLGPDDGDGGIYEPPPRLQTTLTVSRPDGTRSYRLDGNFEPEALSSDGDSLFVISYMPPGDPQRYQVRRLDLDSGAVVDVFTPDEELQQEMGGTARVQAWAPDGSRLYTLYTLDGADGPSAFVHVLALVLDWARSRGEAEVESLVVERALTWYGKDVDCPLSYEPGGEDFLSPSLAEADLMRRVLPGGDFAVWLSTFLRVPSDPASAWLTPAVASDRADGKLAHPDGLNLSRAWMLEGIAAGLPAGDPRLPALREAASRHRRSGLAAVTGAHYEGGHWLASFAIYLLSQRGLPVPASGG